MAYTTIDDPAKHFDTVIWSTQDTSIDTLSFQPDLVWLKSRSNADTQVLFDSIRGANKRAMPSETLAQTTTSDELTAFNSDGFTLGTGDNVNRASQTMVAWSWKAGGSASSNSDGSITSTVSANTTAGFSIVKYTASGSNATIGHGLGTAPAMIIVKGITTDNNWRVGHDDMTSWTYRMNLESNAGESSQANVWNSTAPTSSVFSIGTSSSVNDSGVEHMAYCFAEKKGYSKIGGYVGNADASGTFVYTGFRPAWVFIKSTGLNSWEILDNKRNPSNVMGKSIFPDSNGAEYDYTNRIDMLSNGFKARTNSSGVNGSGVSYIYMAFAESPFVNSNGIPTNAR